MPALVIRLQASLTYGILEQQSTSQLVGMLLEDCLSDSSVCGDLIALGP